MKFWEKQPEQQQAAIIMLKSATKSLALSTLSVVLTVAIFSDQAEESLNLPTRNNELVKVARIEKLNLSETKPLILKEKSQGHEDQVKLGLAGFLIVVGGFTSLVEKNLR